MHVRNFISSLLFLCLAPAASAATSAWHSCHLSGQRDALRCTTLDVPRDYANPAAGSLELHVALAPAVRARPEADPLFVLAGGPGQAGSDIVALLDGALAKVHASRDIVFLDQRGTGRSGRLACDDSNDSLALDDDAVQAALLTCLRGYGAALADFSTAAAADDIERVRTLLGAEQINLWGGSYGSRLAQVYARRYPQQVRSLILDGVVDAALIIGTDSGGFDTALDQVLQRCAADADCARAFPTLRADLQAVLRRLDAGPASVKLSHPRRGEPLTAPLSRQRLFGAIKYQLYTPRGAALLPYLINRAAADDWRPLLSAQATSADLATALPAPGLLMAIACQEDWPRLDADRRAQQHAAATFGSTDLAAMDELCSQLALSPVAAQPASEIAVPALLLSGALDPVTPPASAERALRLLPRGQHLVAAQAGHIVSGLGCAPKLLQRFLAAPGQLLDGSCLAEIALPAFQLSAAGTAP